MWNMMNGMRLGIDFFGGDVGAVECLERVCGGLGEYFVDSHCEWICV